MAYPVPEDERPLTRLQLRLARGRGGEPLQLVEVAGPGDRPPFEVGDRAEFIIDNGSAHSAHVVLVEIGVDGVISALLPAAAESSVARSVTLAPGETMHVGRDAYGAPEGLPLDVPEAALAGGAADLCLALWASMTPFALSLDELGAGPDAAPERDEARPVQRLTLRVTSPVAPVSILGDGALIARGPLGLVVNGWRGEARFEGLDHVTRQATRSSGEAEPDRAGVPLEDGEAVPLGLITLELHGVEDTRSLDEGSVQVLWEDAGDGLRPVLLTDDGPDVAVIVLGERDTAARWRFEVPTPEDAGAVTRAAGGGALRQLLRVFGLRGSAGREHPARPSPDDLATLAGGGLHVVVGGPGSGPARTAAEIRRHYLQLTAVIPEADASWAAAGLETCDRAQRAFAMRRQARLSCRAMMQSRLELLLLQLRDLWVYTSPNGPTFDSLVARMRRRGQEGEDACAAILESSTRSNDRVNKLLGVRKETLSGGDA